MHGLRNSVDSSPSPELTLDKAFESFTTMLKDNSIKSYMEGYVAYANPSDLLNSANTQNIELQLKVQKFFVDRLHMEMRTREGNTIGDSAKKVGHRMMSIYETERMRSYNWGAYNGLKDSGEEVYQIYDQSNQSIIDNRKISETKYHDLPPDHPNSKVIIRKANEKK